MVKKSIAIEALKSTADQPFLIDAGQALRQLITDKKYSFQAVRGLAADGDFGQLFNHLVLRLEDDNVSTDFDSAEIFNYFGAAVNNLVPANTDQFIPYVGTHEQNSLIDRALSANASHRDPDYFFAPGIATSFNISDYGYSLASRVTSVPIAVVGYGMAGILMAHALNKLGFYKVDIYERSRPRGVWANPNAYRGSRNNPRKLTAFGEVLDAAPGEGREIYDFLGELKVDTEEITKANVTRIVPGDLEQTLYFASGEPKKYPIVINAVGIGKPKPLSDARRMITTEINGGRRWQVILKREDVRGKRFTFNGLGNSTAEMIRQLYAFIDEGVDTDFRVITHYPKEAVYAPDSAVVIDGRTYRVFRDLSLPNLVRYQGDLPDTRRDYFRALRDDRIFHSVKQWSMSGETMVLSNGRRVITSYPNDELFTLIGYKHPAETLVNMGCQYDYDNECAQCDYDGEMHQQSSSSESTRVHKGYFGFGSVLETPFNPNAVVIPGMLHRIGDQLFSVVLRAAEYSSRQ